MMALFGKGMKSFYGNKSDLENDYSSSTSGTSLASCQLWKWNIQTLDGENETFLVDLNAATVKKNGQL